MERNKKTPLLLVLVPLLQVSTASYYDCPSLPVNNLTCYNDFSQNITCMWNSTYTSDHTDTVCTIHAMLSNSRVGRDNNAACNLEPVDASRPALKKCSLIFKIPYTFVRRDVLSINVNCNPARQSVNILYKPVCHVKVNPPGKPDVNFTIVSWSTQVTKHAWISNYKSELQWKRQEKSWTDPSVQKNETRECKMDCEVELDPDLLIQDERYEARVRVQSNYIEEGTWSDWSPTASWVSPVGEPKPPSGITVGVLQMTAAAVVGVLVLLMAVVLFRSDKTTWVYMVKRIKGPPLPNPANSFLKDVDFQSWLNPHFASESFPSFLKPVEIVTVEVTSTVDVVAPCKPDLKMLRNKDGYESTSPSFSNPSYSDLCTPPVSSLTAGNLQPCASDTPYGPVGCQGEGKKPEQDSSEVRKKEEVEILKLLSKGSSNSEPVQVISDYEKAEKVQVRRFRLQSLDSGMCSGEEISQESMDPDSINVTGSHDEGLEGEEEKEGGTGKLVNFQKLFGSIGGIFGKESIQVCSDYEQVQKVQADSPELPSLDSGISSGGEEQVSQEESMEDGDKSTESTRFLFPPHPSSPLPCSLFSLPQLPLNFSGPGLSAALPLPSHILERIAVMSTSRSVEPSGDGYMPVIQEQS